MFIFFNVGGGGSSAFIPQYKNIMNPTQNYHNTYNIAITYLLSSIK